MNPPEDSAARPDLVDTLAGLEPGSATHLLRHRRDKVAKATQGSYEALFDPRLPGLGLDERLLVALYACRLSKAPDIAAHYRDRLAATGVDPAVLAEVEAGDAAALPQPRLRAMLAFTRILVERPVEGDEAALRALVAAGLSTPEVVALAQLIAFLSYQTRLVAGLAALAGASAPAGRTEASG